jgi:diguanylate cyclase (GGDEF)-like protein/PAS domain S-box-containing protein
VIETADRVARWPVAGLAGVATLAAAIFALDVATPRGLIGGALYAALVLASAWLPWPKAPLGAAVLATLLNVVGHAVSTGGFVPTWVSLINQMAASAMIWTTALLLYRRLELDRALAASRARYQALLAERVLEESRDHYRQLVDASPDAIIVHQDGMIRFVNPGAVALVGAAEPRALIGLPLVRFLPQPRRRKVEARAGQPRDSGQPARWVEQRLLRLDRRTVEVEVGGVGITVDAQPAVQTIVRDISARKRAERELARAYGLLNQHLANTPLGVLEWEGKRDRVGHLRIRRWSGQAEAIFGFSEAEMTGKRWDELALVGTSDAEKANASAGDLVRGVKPRNVVTLRSHAKDGSFRVCRWYNSVLLSEKGGDLTVLSLVEDITELVEAEERIRHLAHHDALTGLPNRLLLEDRVEQALARARRAHDSVAVMLLDVDNFKTINDTLGHPSGDELIRSIAARVHALVRESDTVARVGGDEFAIVQTELRDLTGAAVLAGKIMSALREPFDLDDWRPVVGASIGIALFPQDGDSLESLLKHADMALYRAKAEGRNRYAFFEPDMNVEVMARRSMEEGLLRALAGDELAVFYQPQFDIRTRDLVGVEALARWRHPRGGLVLPGAFIPVAEVTGLIQPIGEWILRQACRDARSWREAGAPVRVGVNLSPSQVRERELAERIPEILAEFGLEPAQLELEITETLFLSPADTSHLAALAERGIRFAIDDFGIGYSSLAYLNRFPFDRIKIDRSFIAEIGESDHAETIIRTIVQLGHNLGKLVLAEGVETETQLAFLQRAGCDQAQGFLLGRPQPADLLAQSRAA